MDSVRRWIVAGAMCLGTASVMYLTGCAHHHHDHDHDYVDVVDAHGWHHQGYYDEGHSWHGGYYDDNHAWHDDAGDWHH